VAELMGAGSLRSALALLEEPAEASGEEPRRWPAYIEATGRVAKLAGYVEKHPVSQWPLEGQEKFRDELRPIVKALWPGLEV